MSWYVVVLCFAVYPIVYGAIELHGWFVRRRRQRERDDFVRDIQARQPRAGYKLTDPVRKWL